MIYVLAFLSVYFLFSIHRVIRSFAPPPPDPEQAKKIEALKKEVSALEEKNAVLDQKRKRAENACFELSGKIDSLNTQLQIAKRHENTEALQLGHELIAAVRQNTEKRLPPPRDIESVLPAAVDHVSSHFPPYDPKRIYYTNSGRLFHAVPWCYALDLAKEIIPGTESVARSLDLYPCRRCIERY